MKKTALLNAQLSYCIARLGHTDSITICDAGLPIGKDMARIDLALTAGVPSFLATVAVVAEEMFIERAVVATEIEEKSPQILSALLALIGRIEQQQGNRITVEFVSHAQFKLLSQQSNAVVRTGECSPYANVIFYSGVPF